MTRRLSTLIGSLGESWSLAHDSIRMRPGRSILAILGVVIGIVTVVFVSAVLAGLRAQVALLFREFGTDNVFAYHRSGDPYARPSEEEARRRPLDPVFAKGLALQGEHIQAVAVQVIVPPLIQGRPLIVRGGGNESETALVEGLSANFFDVTGAEFAAGRPFTEVEDARGARVAVLGASTARALFGSAPSVGREVAFGGALFQVVGESAPRRGGFFGENRQDSVIAIPRGTAARLFSEAKETVFYIQARPGQRDQAYRESEAILRQLRRLGPDEPNDFNLSTADQIIAQLDRVSAAVGLATLALAGVSLVIGGIGIANVMLIAVAERTREIGLRMAIGARRRVVLRQFLLEAAVLSFSGGVAGVLIAALLGLGLSLLAPGLFGPPPRAHRRWRASGFARNRHHRRIRSGRASLGARPRHRSPLRMIPRRLRVVRGFIVSCALGLAATGLALFILEGATRLIGWHGPALTASSEGDRGLWAYDATKGWFHRPFQSGRVDLGGPDAGRVRINSWGFRGPEPVAAPSRGQRRVLVFGDSFVFGIGVDEEHLFTAHLKRFLDRAGLEHEVINAGVSGYSTDQELILFSELGPKLSPDFVVLVACDNDFAGNTEDFAYQRYPKPYFDLAPDGELILRNSPVPELRAAQRVKLWLGQHSNLWNLVRNRRSDFPALQSGLNGFEVGIARPNSTDRVALTFALVRAFHTLAQRLGAGFVLVNTGHRGEQTPLFHALRGRMRRAGLPFLGLEAALGEARRAHPTGTWDFPKDTHWNLDAHRLAAQQVANFIRSVPPPAP